MKTEVHFCSTAFNCTEPQDYFINDCCFGDDVVRWLIAQLQKQGLQTSGEAGQEDFGWYFDFQAGGVAHCFVVGFQPNDLAKGDRWIGLLERPTSFFQKFLGEQRHKVLREAIAAIDVALKSSSEIHQVVWHTPGEDDGPGDL